MCFTVNVNLIKEELQNRYGATLIDPDKYRPSYYYHAFGLPEMPVVPSDNPAGIRLMRWGLIPGWVKTRESAEEIRYRTFNARGDSVASKLSFSSSFNTKRCIVPVRGFFEWQHTEAGKIPWYIFRTDSDIMSLAGLWSRWTDPSSGELLDTFSIITTDANEMMARIHNSKKRMPAVIEKGMEHLWLDLRTDSDALKRVIGSYGEDILSAHTISDLVNSKNTDRNSAEIITPFVRASENLLF